LRQVGVVSMSKQGQQRVYDLNLDQLRPVAEWVLSFERHWEHQLERIRVKAEQRARAASEKSAAPTTPKKGAS
jgi:hypothetical protein